MARNAIVLVDRTERLTHGWTETEIREGLARPRTTYGIDNPSDPMPRLRSQRGWWLGAIFTRKLCADQDRERASRFLEVSAGRSDADAPTEIRFGDTLRFRDAAFAAVAASEKCHAIADHHERTIADYQAQMGRIGA